MAIENFNTHDWTNPLQCGKCGRARMEVEAINMPCEIKNTTPPKSEVPLDGLLAALGVTDEWRIENIKETAMNRHSVKKSKRPYVKKILDEAFELLKQKGS